MIAADDLMTLLDAGMQHSAAAEHSGGGGVIIDSDTMFGEEMFSYSSLRARAAASSGSGSRPRVASKYSGFRHSNQLVI
jgi:hypothetical protein